MSTSGSKSNEHVAHFLVDIHNIYDEIVFSERLLSLKCLSNFSFSIIAKDLLSPDIIQLSIKLKRFYRIILSAFPRYVSALLTVKSGTAYS